MFILRDDEALSEYFQWLLELVGGQRYIELFTKLFEREFTWTVPNDDNRASDGLALRDIFFDETGVKIDSAASCSVLEMLIALAIRCEEDVMGDPGNDQSDTWFWLMIDNLGLKNCTDGHFNADFVDQKLNIWLDRRYGRNGKGGLFPLKGDYGDQRRTEIWFQMNLYLGENEVVFE